MSRSCINRSFFCGAGAGGFLVEVSGLDLRRERCKREHCWRCHPQYGHVNEDDPHYLTIAGPVALSLGVISKQPKKTKAAFVKDLGERRQLQVQPAVHVEGSRERAPTSPSRGWWLTRVHALVTMRDIQQQTMQTDSSIPLVLQENSLVMLRNGDSVVSVGRVACRELTVDTSMDPDVMAHVSIAFDHPTVVLAAASDGGDGHLLRLFGFTGAFFAYEPVLSCLQRIEYLPFHDELLLTAAAVRLCPRLPKCQSLINHPSMFEDVLGSTAPKICLPHALPVLRYCFAGWQRSRVAAA